MTRHTAILLCLHLPLVGCVERRSDEARPALKPSSAPDRRPQVRRDFAGIDVTEQARKDNAESEPPLPSSRGQAHATHVVPAIVRTKAGFVARLHGGAVATPAYHQGKIITGAAGRTELHAVDAESGRPAWSLSLSDDGPTGPGCEDGTCVFNTYSCTLFAVDARTGKHLWSWWLGSPQRATPVIAQKTVYTSYPDGSGPLGARYVLAAFELHTGKPLWRRRIDAEVNATPVAHDGRIYLATQVGTVYEFAAATGDLLQAKKSASASAPIVSGELVFFNRHERDTASELIGTAYPVFPEIEPQATPSRALMPKARPLLAGQRVVTAEGGLVSARDLKTGRRLWQRELESEAAAEVAGPLIYAGQSVLLATARGNILRLEAQTGKIVDRFELGAGALASEPIAVDGWLYAGTFGGTLVAHDTGDRALSGWPMLGGGPERRGGVEAGGS